ELMCASLLHDRNRWFFGHLETEVIQRVIMTGLRLESDFQDRVMEIISSHSNLVQEDPFKEEKEILFLADKKEFVNWKRAEVALKKMPRWIVAKYVEEWKNRIPLIEESVIGFRDK